MGPGGDCEREFHSGAGANTRTGCRMCRARPGRGEARMAMSAGGSGILWEEGVARGFAGMRVASNRRALHRHPASGCDVLILPGVGLVVVLTGSKHSCRCCSPGHRMPFASQVDLQLLCTSFSQHGDRDQAFHGVQTQTLACRGPDLHPVLPPRCYQSPISHPAPQNRPESTVHHEQSTDRVPQPSHAHPAPAEG